MIVQGIHKKFGKNQVLKGVSLEMKEGRITAVLGPNGSGKTTLIKSILGMVIQDEGTVMAGGKDTRGRWDYRSDIGYLPQIARFPENLRVSELIRMVKDIRGSAADATPLIRLFELEDFLNRPLRYLSGGTRQKVNIVLAFMFDTRYYILDEPTAGLDPLALIGFKKLVREEKQKGKSILLTTHIMSLVEDIADEVVFLLEGEIYFSGSVQEMKDKYAQASLEEAIAALLSEKRDV